MAVIGRSIPLIDCANTIVQTGFVTPTAKNTGTHDTKLNTSLNGVLFKSVDSPKLCVKTYAAESAAIGIEDTAAAKSPILNKKYAILPRMGSRVIAISLAP